MSYPDAEDWVDNHPNAGKQFYLDQINKRNDWEELVQRQTGFKANQKGREHQYAKLRRLSVPELAALLVTLDHM